MNVFRFYVEGFVKLGVEPSFLNYNLRAKSLLHCFNVSESKILFMGAGNVLIIVSFFHSLMLVFVVCLNGLANPETRLPGPFFKYRLL